MLNIYVSNLTHFERPNCLFYKNIAILFQVRQFLDKKLQISKPISSHSAACSTCVRKYLTHTCTRARLFPFEAELLEAAGDFVNRGQWKLPVRNKVNVYKSCGDSKNRMFMKH